MRPTLAILVLPLALLALPATAADANVTVLLKVGAGSYLAPGAICPVSVPAGSDGGAVLDAAVAVGCITSWSAQSFPGYGRFVDCIDGLCAHNAGDAHPAARDLDGTYWEFSVGAHSASVGIDGYQAADLDLVGFTYQDWYASFADFTLSTLLP